MVSIVAEEDDRMNDYKKTRIKEWIESRVKKKDYLALLRGKVKQQLKMEESCKA